MLLHSVTKEHYGAIREHFAPPLPLISKPSVLWVVDFDRHLGDENPTENIDETYLCGQKWPYHGSRRESE